jgi:hypothetical protein
MPFELEDGPKIPSFRPNLGLTLLFCLIVLLATWKLADILVWIASNVEVHFK